jgi:glycosyltransferase involved in cell wall biosynthesis/ubiquinone/menaquinone biosynthesis C-methylase UbiE
MSLIISPESHYMRILSILTYYYPHWTGLTQHAVRVAEELAARGHTVTVLTARYTPDLAPEETINGVRVVRLATLGRLSRGMIMPQFPAAATRQIAAHDVVHMHTPMFEAALVAGLCRVLDKPLLMTHHGDLVMPAGPFNQFTEKVVTQLLNIGGRLATRISTYSYDYAAHSRFLQQFAAKLVAISPPITIPTPQPEVVADWRAELGLQDKLLVGFAGRFVEEKGFDFLLDAIPLIKEQIPNVHFVFAGEIHVAYEKFYERCASQIERHRADLTLLGLLRDPQQLANFYAMCDVFTLPSRTDCFAIVQVESLLSGTPLVTANIPGARIVLQTTGMGRLVTPRDPHALAEGLIEVLSHAERYRPDPVAVRAAFDLLRTVDQYEACMQELIGTARTEQRASLPSADGRKLEVLLRNEADMAFRRRAFRLLEWLELRDGERVFDCGCGMGFYLMAMGNLRNLRLVGLDGDVERLRWARSEAVPAQLLSGNILRLPFPDASFDKVLMSEVLEHIDDDRQALREIYRVLKPGGILALSVPHARYPFWWDPINHIWIALGGQPIRSGPIAGIWSNHERLYEPEALAERFRDAGFAIEILEEATHYSFPFIHFLVYGIGKPLIEKNLLPATLRKSADRFSGAQNSGSLLNPINLGLAIFRWIDRLNDRPAVAGKRSFVNVLVKARRPQTTEQPAPKLVEQSVGRNSH